MGLMNRIARLYSQRTFMRVVAVWVWDVGCGIARPSSLGRAVLGYGRYGGVWEVWRDMGGMAGYGRYGTLGRAVLRHPNHNTNLNFNLNVSFNLNFKVSLTINITRQCDLHTQQLCLFDRHLPLIVTNPLPSLSLSLDRH